MKSLPSSLINSLQDVKGFDEQRFLDAHTRSATTSIRLHPVKQSGVFQHEEQVPWCSEGRYLQERPVFTLDPLYHAGAYYVQEASSMFLHYMLQQLLPSKENLKVLDLCAAPGGKSTLIASLLYESSLLISNEVIRSRASILEENMTRWGYMNTWVTCNDPKDFSNLKGYFDVVVTDAPCSGSGLFRKDDRAIDEWSEANVQLCCGRQQRILADIWPAIKEDGLLLYATCSYSPEEDEQILDWLATEYSVESLAVDVPEECGIVTVTSPQKNMVGYRFFPGNIKGEGFFIAALRKKEGADTVRYPKFRSANDKKVQQLASYLLTGEDIVYVQTGKELYNAIYAVHEPELQLIQKSLYLRKAGVMVGAPAVKEWVPGHDVALSINRSGTLNSVDVTKEQALLYLKKEDAGLPVLDKGWYVVTYNGLGLGWIKSVGSRVNNYLPKHWRIRMEIPDTDRA